MAGTDYSMGFAISLDGSQVLLLEKNRPAFLMGQWVGVAGHVDPGETPLQAMRREAHEEADLELDDWQDIGMVRGQNNPEDRIFMFAAFADLSQARTMTDEPVQVFTWQELEKISLAASTQAILPAVRRFAEQTPGLGETSVARRPKP